MEYRQISKKQISRCVKCVNKPKRWKSSLLSPEKNEQDPNIHLYFSKSVKKIKDGKFRVLYNALIKNMFRFPTLSFEWFPCHLAMEKFTGSALYRTLTRFAFGVVQYFFIHFADKSNLLRLFYQTI